MNSENIIYEYSRVDNKDLALHVKEFSLLHKYFKADFDGIKARQYCGILNYDNKDFYILPKISKEKEHNLDIFIYMLRYVYDIKLENEDISNSKNEKNSNFLEIFIQMFAKNLLKEFQKGVYKNYITCKDNLTTLRGKYLINENLKHNFTNAKIYCEYDEFSMDNELNQFFLYAIKTLLPFTKNKKLLKQCELVLDEVTCRHFDIKTLHVNFQRLNNRFKDSYEFALLLLNKSIPLFEKDKKSFAFLFDMNVLFESFIGKLYKEIDNSTQLQKEETFENLKLKPDIIVPNKNLIIDCKYKVLKDGKISSREDRYQMFVYGTNFGIKNTMLLYPEHILHVEKNLYLGKDDKIINLKMRSIDLDFCGGYLDYINEMKKRLEDTCK